MPHTLEVILILTCLDSSVELLIFSSNCSKCKGAPAHHIKTSTFINNRLKRDKVTLHEAK